MEYSPESRVVLKKALRTLRGRGRGLRLPRNWSGPSSLRVSRTWPKLVEHLNFEDRYLVPAMRDADG